MSDQIIYLGVERKFGTKKDNSGSFDWTVLHIAIPAVSETVGKMNISATGLVPLEMNFADGVDGLAICKDLEVFDEIDLQTVINMRKPNSPPRVSGITRRTS